MLPVRPHSALLALLAAAALALAACGGGDADEGSPSTASLATAFKPQRATLQSIGEDIQTAVAEASSKSDDALAQQFAALADRADAAHDGLAALEPTDATRPDLERLHRAVGDGARELRAIAKAAEDGDAEAARAATVRLIATGEAIGKGIDAVAAKLGLPRTKPSRPQRAAGKISVRYEQPADRTARLAQEILAVGGTDGVAAGFTKTFALPSDLEIRVVNGSVGPHYDPSQKAVTLSYGFVDYVAAIVRRGVPGISEDELGANLASINGFILVHELGHAFVDLFDLPITGREEDAVDQLATVFLVDAVPNGDQYAFNAARFFRLLSRDRKALDESDFWDEHALDAQRAYDIVCAIAGSSQQRFRRIAQLEILGERRLQRCPAEYRQKTRAWKALLQPHTR